MKSLIFILLVVFLSYKVRAAEDASYTTVKCELKIDFLKPSRTDVSMTGTLMLEDDVDGDAYLTLEPISSIEAPVSARILLTRFDGREYFPMRLHPRGDTVSNLANKEIQGLSSASVDYTDENAKYDLTCIKL